jgi:hypothetical protein
MNSPNLPHRSAPASSQTSTPRRSPLPDPHDSKTSTIRRSPIISHRPILTANQMSPAQRSPLFLQSPIPVYNGSPQLNHVHGPQTIGGSLGVPPGAVLAAGGPPEQEYGQLAFGEPWWAAYSGWASHPHQPAGQHYCHLHSPPPQVGSYT